MKNTKGEVKAFRISNTAYHVFWCLLLAAAAMGAAVHLERHQSYSADKQALQILIEQQHAANESLRRELDYYGTDAYVERIAGERLGLVKPDEIVFYNSEEQKHDS